MVHRAFTGGQSKNYPFSVCKPIQGSSKPMLQTLHHLFREEVDHAEYQQGLVVGSNAFMKIGWAQVLGLPAMENLGNTCAGLLAHANNDGLAQIANHHHII